MRHAWVVLTAACAAATPQWEKAGATHAAVEEAMQQCRVQASLTPTPSPGALGPKSGSTPMINRVEDREAREAQQFQKCMHDQGFSAKR